PHRPVADDVAHRLRAISAIQQAGSSPSPTRSRSKVVRSLAVLPFAATLRREGGDLLADGIAEGLITGLGSFRSLRVISPASARRFRGSDKRPSEIGAELRVDAVLRGHILESPAGRLMLDVELMETTHDLCLWSGQFECERSDVLDVEAQIAHAVA